MKTLKMQASIDISRIPVQKRILNTGITVDCFNIPIANGTHYFLSHFHSDHYTGLTKSFKFPVFCSKTTAMLACTKLGVDTVGLEMYTNYSFEGFVVRLIEANHCPGAVCLIFLIDDQFILHTGDFRYDKTFHRSNIKFRSVYLDNTYQGFLSFPTQKEVITKILKKCDQASKLCKQAICVLCCTYCIGKEKIFLSVADYLDEMVQVSEEKMTIYKCYSEYTVKQLNRDIKRIVSGKRAMEPIYGFSKEAKPRFQSSGLGNIEKTENRKTGKTENRKKGLLLDPPEVVKYTSKSIELLDSIPHSKHSHDTYLSDGFAYLSDEFECSPIIETDKIFYQEKIDQFTTVSVDSPRIAKIEPFDRITTKESPIKVISMSDMKRLDQVISGIYADKIIVLCGSGWNEKEEYRTYKRMDGKIIKRGIEIVYFRYSEHSSSQELEEFKNNVCCESFIGTVI